MNYRFIARAVGTLQILLACSMLAPLAWSIGYGDGDHWAILLAMAVTGALGLALVMMGRGASDEFFRREALAVVGLGWTVSCVTGALPFIFSGTLGIIDAFFETASGLTTTGSTVISDINGMLTGDDAVHGIMFWRSFLHWLGGMGIVVLLLALLPAVGASSKFLFQSESTGPQAEGLRPRIRHTAMRLWFLYVGLSVVQFTLLKICGMSVYDAMCHTFGTMATGGFSTENASIAAFNSFKIETIIVVFMFLAGTSFTLHHQVLTGKIGAWFRSPEFCLFAAIFLVCSVGIALDLVLRGPSEYSDEGFIHALRHSSFTTLSIVTTTGFGLADFDLWPASSKAVLLALMFVGGCAGSTGGGVKVIRFMILFKVASHQFQKIFNPRRLRTMRIGERVIDDEMQQMALVYFFVIALIFSIASLLMCIMIPGDLVTAVTSVIATLNNIGPGLGQVGATCTFADIPALGKILLSFCMIAGRLELWAFLCLFLPSFWRTR